MKLSYFSLLKLNRFDFGDRTIHQLVLFESKHLFSIIFFWFHSSNNVQDRFHTHAFNAYSFKLFGSYDEHVLLDESTGESIKRKRTAFLQYFPRDSYHAIGKSKRGCITLLLSGPWKETWKEWKDGKVEVLAWNRKPSEPMI